MKYKNDPKKLVSDKPGRGAVAQLTGQSFPPPFMNDELLLAVERACGEGMSIDLQRTEKTDRKIVAGFQNLGIIFRKTARESSNMDNHVRPDERHSLNGYLWDQPAWFNAYARLFAPNSEKREINGRPRIACLSFVLFLIAVGFNPKLVESMDSARERKEKSARFCSNPEKFIGLVPYDEYPLLHMIYGD